MRHQRTRPPQTLRPNPSQRALANAAVIIVILIIGLHIPVPGIDLHFFDQAGSANAGQYSVLALGIGPITTVLAYAEIAKLAFPSLAEWQTRNALLATLLLSALIIVVAAFQAHQFMLAMQLSGVEAYGAIGFVPVGIVTLIGGVLLMVWLTKFTGFAHFTGFWMLYAGWSLLGLMDQTVQWSGFTWNGEVAVQEVLMITSLLAVFVGLTVFARLVLRWNGQVDEPACALLLWPPVLTGIVASHVFTLATLLVPPVGIYALYSWEAVYLLTALVTIPVAVHLYARTLSQPVQWPALVCVATVQFVICATMCLLWQFLRRPLDVNGSDIIAISAVVLALINPTIRLQIPRRLFKR